MRPTLLALLASLLATGCATNLALLQTAETLDGGELRFSGGGGAFVPVGSLQEAEAMADIYADELAAIQQGQGELPDEAAQREIIRLVADLAVFTPEPVAEGAVRLGLADGLDAGFEWSSSAWRGDLKLRLTPRGAPVAVALLVGAELYTFDVDLFSLDSRLEATASRIFEYVELEAPRRYDAEAALLMSWGLADVVHLYGGARYRTGRYHLPVRLHVQTDTGLWEQAETLDGVLHFAGATVGLGVGPDFFRIFAELSGGLSWSDTEVLGQPERLGGITAFPAAGLSLNF